MSGIPNKAPRVTIWVESNYSEGHVASVHRLAHALHERGVDVTVLGERKTLAKREWDGASTIETPSYIQDGFAEKVYEALEQTNPDIIVTEMVPMGMGKQGWHLKGALEKFKARKQQYAEPLSLVSWTRDVPDNATRPGDDRYEGQTKDMVKLYDTIMIRGDREFLPYHLAEKVFGGMKWTLRGKVEYSGYPIPELGPLPSSGEVVVGAGGDGSHDRYLFFKKTLDAYEYLPDELKQKPWHFFVADDMKPKYRDDLIQRAREIGPHIQIDSVGPHFKDAMRAADLCVLQGGMSAVEAACLHKPTVIMPNVFSQFIESYEQATRANALEKNCNYIKRVLPLDGEDPELLAKYITQVSKVEPEVKGMLPMLNGHEHFADWLVARCKQQEQGAGIGV